MSSPTPRKLNNEESIDMSAFDSNIGSGIEISDSELKASHSHDKEAEEIKHKWMINKKYKIYKSVN